MGKEVRRIRRRRQQSTAPRTRLLHARNLLFLGALGVGFLFGFFALRYIPRVYFSWREGQLLERASGLIKQGEFTAATEAAQQALRSRPNSVAAFRIMAEATEKQNRSETVAWRWQIARAQPQNLDAQLNLASAALRFGQLDTARKALEDVAPASRDKAPYHVVAGWLARAQGNERDVESHFAAALAQEPTNETYQFNLAVLRIRSSDPTMHQEARATLERLSKDQAFRTGALRALLSDAINLDDLPRADSFAQDLQLAQQVTFADYLLCLDFYRKLDEAKFAAVLEKIKPVAARNERDLALLMDWMIQNGQAAEVLKWSDKLPPEITTRPPPAISIAEAFAETKNWSRLRRWTRSGAWGATEYLRHAYQAYAARQTRQSATDAEFNSLWSLAERATGENPEHAAILARLAGRWNLPGEAEQLWLRVAKHPPMRREALEALARIYRVGNDLKNLLAILKQLHESSPREPALAADYARLALLIEPSTADAQRVAKEAFDAAPADAKTAITYAFALYGLGRTGEGLKVMRDLPPQELLDSHAAVYAAVLLLDDNQDAAAQEYVTAARQGPLFPEEKKLLDDAVEKSKPPAMEIASPTPAPAPAP